MSIVVLGALNPAIFQPGWFVRNELLPAEELENAQITLFQSEFVSIETQWLGLEVLQPRLMVATTDAAYFEALRDLVIGVFTLLGHTPVNALGINESVHFRSASEKKWHEFGHKFVPKEPWGDLLIRPGMRSLTVEGMRPDQRSGYVRVQLEPSVRVHPGVFVSTNDHFALMDGDGPQDGAAAASLIEGVWDDSRTRSGKILEYLLQFA